MKVAALYIDERGPYVGLPDVEVWDMARDARLYDGPWPVVAHPPCGAWGRLKRQHRAKDADCAPRAVAQVQRWGGVLEHPAHSSLWSFAGLPLPGQEPDEHGGITLEVDQVHWGHVARKRTWLYGVGVDWSLVVPPFPKRKPTHWVSGHRYGGKPERHSDAVPPGIKICSSQQRRRTPPAFRDLLLDLARSVR